MLMRAAGALAQQIWTLSVAAWRKSVCLPPYPKMMASVADGGFVFLKTILWRTVEIS